MCVMQIVQRFAPGGLEIIAASLQGRWSADCRIVSLDGAAGRLLEAWPAMGGLRANLVGMGKMPGIDLPCLARLTRRMMDHKPDASSGAAALWGNCGATCAGSRHCPRRA